MTDDRLLAAAACFLLVLAPPTFAAPLVEKGTLIRVAVVDTPLLSEGQVSKLTPAKIVDNFAEKLASAGYLVEGQAGGSSLVINITAYDSGRYFGFKKTARMDVEYRLLDRNGHELAWQDVCAASAKFDLQSTEKRNADAVAVCLSALTDRLARRLGAPE